jgi:putative ATP-dependent endonuclease of OLD family
MRLMAIQIENFRGLRNLRVELSPTTLLIGENNAGKTSILDAIRLALSRSAGRKTGTFESYDYHLSTPQAEPQSADPLGITLMFAAEPGEVLQDEFVQALGDVIVTDAGGNPFIIFRVTSVFDGHLNDFVTEWQFLDVTGNPLGPKSKRPSVLQDFQRIFPVFYLSALRDAVREFRTGTFWTPFIKNPSMSDNLKQELQQQIDELNRAVLDAHDSLKAVKDHLVMIRDLVPLGTNNTVDIDALPGRISDLLTSTQVNVRGVTGASIPLARHGAGTQSLSVLFLFHAYLTAMLQQQYSALSAPILALEEPEAHLHPFGTRALWSTLEAIPGQKIIASHSGDLVANAPLTCIRRLHSTDAGIQVGSITDGLLNATEERQVQFHITSSRGELLFARCWLLYEGESEHWILDGLARTEARAIDRWGVRLVPYRFSGHHCLLKVANALQIPWFLLADGDDQGNKTVAATKVYLNGAKESDRIFRIPEDSIELHLCAHGFGAVFESHISAQKRALVTAKPGDPKYWDQVLKAADDTPKPELIQEIVRRIEQGSQAPPQLVSVLDRALALAGA